MDNDRTDASAPNGKKRRFLKKITFSKIMKLAAVLIIILVYFLLFFRMYLAGDHGVMNSFSYTESTVNNAGSLRLMTQTLDKTITDNGFYSISNLVF